MTKEITYYFAPISPWTYLGHQRFIDLAAANGAKIIFRPCNILDVFERTGGMPAGKRPLPRRKYRMVELKRWRSYLGIDLNLEPKFFPVSDELAARLIIACVEEPICAQLSMSLMRATWAEERDISDEGTLLEICRENGLDGEHLMETARSQVVTEAYAQNTEMAIEADVFGAPTYIYQGENFWGQDRLDFLERALKG